MDKILDMISKWDMLGQGCFLSFVVFMFVVLCMGMCKLFVALFHGWPKADDNTDDSKTFPSKKKAHEQN